MIHDDHEHHGDEDYEEIYQGYDSFFRKEIERPNTYHHSYFDVSWLMTMTNSTNLSAGNHKRSRCGHEWLDRLCRVFQPDVTQKLKLPRYPG